jgi:hypothetical protein
VHDVVPVDLDDPQGLADLAAIRSGAQILPVSETKRGHLNVKDTDAATVESKEHGRRQTEADRDITQKYLLYFGSRGQAGLSDHSCPTTNCRRNLQAIYDRIRIDQSAVGSREEDLDMNWQTGCSQPKHVMQPMCVFGNAR